MKFLTLHRKIAHEGFRHQEGVGILLLSSSPTALLLEQLSCEVCYEALNS